MANPKMQSTYRAGASTPQWIVDAIEEGVQKAGSFSRYVNHLIVENAQLGGEGGAPPEVIREMAEQLATTEMVASSQYSVPLVRPGTEATVPVPAAQMAPAAEPVPVVADVDLTELEEGILELSNKAMTTNKARFDQLEKMLADLNTEIVEARRAVLASVLETSSVSVPDAVNKDDIEGLRSDIKKILIESRSDNIDTCNTMLEVMQAFNKSAEALATNAYVPAANAKAEQDAPSKPVEHHVAAASQEEVLTEPKQVQPAPEPVESPSRPQKKGGSRRTPLAESVPVVEEEPSNIAVDAISDDALSGLSILFD